MTDDQFLTLTETGASQNWTLPKLMNNHGNLQPRPRKWLGEQAKQQAMEIYPGFAAAEVQ